MSGFSAPAADRPEEHVGAGQRLFQRTRFGRHCVGRLELVHVAAARIERALAVAHNHMVVGHAHRLDQLGAGDRRRARAVDHNANVLELSACEIAGIDKAGSGNDRRAVLVVMKDRNVHPFLQGLLDDEAVGRSDIFQVDAAEARSEQRHCIDEFLRVLCIDFQVDRIDVGEALEQHRLAFHHRLRRQRPEVAEAEDGRAVGDDGDEIALGREIVGLARFLGDGLDRDRHSGRIGEAQVALGRHRLRRDDLDLARASPRVEIQRFGAREFDVALAHSLSCRAAL